MAERVDPREDADEERRQRRLQDPEVQQRLHDIREAIGHGPTNRVVHPEELPDFLGEQRQ
jgi:hypothetical protein